MVRACNPSFAHSSISCVLDNIFVPRRAVDVDGGSDAVGTIECDLCPIGREQKGSGRNQWAVYKSFQQCQTSSSSMIHHHHHHHAR
eukprot:3640299-Amphidinium_carterae.1